MKKLLTLLVTISVFATAQAQQRVGIGTATPADKLHVIGNIRIPFQQSIKSENNVGVPVEMIQMNLVGADPKIVIGDYPDGSTNQWGIRLLTSTNPTGAVDIWNGTNSVAWFGQNGTVGINTITPDPAFKLDVYGWIAARSLAANQVGAVVIYDETGTTSGLHLYKRGTTSPTNLGLPLGSAEIINYSSGSLGIINRTATGYIAFGTNDPMVERMRIDAAGNVGIGTTTPTALLDVNGNMTAQGGTFTSSLYVTPVFRFTNATEAAGRILQSDASGFATWVDPASLPITETDPQVSSTTTNYVPKWNGTTLVDGLIYDNATNVGIGTTTPTEELEIRKDQNSGTLLRVQNSTNGTGAYSAVYASTGTGGLAIQASSPNYTTVSVVDLPNSGMLRTDQTLTNGLEVGAGGTNPLKFFTNDTERARFDGTTGNFGIGTTTPSQKLDVAGTTRTTNFQMTSGATNTYVLQSNASGVGTWTDPASLATANIYNSDGTLTGSRTVLFSGNPLTLRLSGASSAYFAVNNQNNDEIFRVSHGGHTFIGSAANSSSDLYIYRRIIDANNNAYFIDPEAASEMSELQVDGITTDNDPSYTFINDGNTGMFSPVLDNVALTTGGTERMRVDASGNVGIGTTTPAEEMHIRKDQNDLTRLTVENSTNGTLSASSVFVASNGSSVVINAYSPTFVPVVGVDMANSGMVTTGSGALNGLGIGTGGNAPIRFVTQYTERMRLDGVGNFGIGTISPTSTLHVAGSFELDNGSEANGRVLVSNASGVGTWTDVNTAVGNGYIKNQTTQQATSDFNISATGTIGTTLTVGTTGSFGGDVTVTGNDISGSTTGDANFNFASLGGARVFLDTDGDGSESFAIRNSSNDLVMEVTEGGNINLDNTGDKLMRVNAEGVANNNANAITIQGGNAIAGGTNNRNGGAVNLTSGVSTGSGNSDIIFNTATTGASGNTVNTVSEKMRILGSGNVGIGTTTPSQKLDVVGTTKTTNFQMTSGAAASTVLTGDGSGNGSWTTIASILAMLGTGTTNQVVKFTSPSTVGNSQITDDGTNVGIGTATPSSFKLQVVGHVGPDADDVYDLGSNALRWRDLYVGPASMHVGTSTADEGNISYNTASNILNIGTDGTSNGDVAFFTNDLYLDKSSGNVGINTTTPSTTLDVAGTLTTTGFIMPTGASNGYVLTSGGSGTGTWQSLPVGIGGTLDDAYDFGGAGAGRVIVADAGAVRISGIDGFYSTGTFGNGAIPATGAGARMMWYPNKAAFRVGEVTGTEWDNGNIGNYSTAMGYNTIASNDYSFASGNNTTASGDNSTAMGDGSTAGGDHSLAMGGYFNNASGDYSIAMGLATTASGDYSTAIGHSTDAIGDNSIATGYFSAASGEYSTAMGNYANAIGYASAAIGDGPTASGLGSTAMGYYTIASGYASTAMGWYPEASGLSSTAMGNNTNASGSYTTAMGANTFAKSGYEMTVGRWNTNYTPDDTLGWDTDDRLFTIGNGTGSGSRSNAVTVLKNGNVGIGTADPASKLQVNNGDVYVRDSANGVIVKSPDGNCWRIQVDNSGAVITTSIACP